MTAAPITAETIATILDQLAVPTELRTDPELQAVAYGFAFLNSPATLPEARFYDASTVFYDEEAEITVRAQHPRPDGRTARLPGKPPHHRARVRTMTTPHPVDGFKISPRIPLEVDLFRETNPSGRIYPDAKEEPFAGYYGIPSSIEDDRYLAAISRAPIGAGGLWDEHTADQYQPNDLTHDQPGGTEPQNETKTHTENTTSTRGKGTIMAGETTITVIGNLTNDPELRFTPSGSAVSNFTIASTPRTFDRQSNEWKDGETLFLRASVWREAAENVAESLTKGTRVIVSGRLKSRSYETKEGEKRTVIELEVDEIGPSLRYANAKVNRTQRSNQGAGNGGGFGNQPTAGQGTQQDDPWAANPSANAGSSWGNGPDSEPPF